MEGMAYLLEGFQSLASAQVLIALLTGVLLGTAVGMIPGIGPVAGMAIMLPFTFGLEPASGVLLLLGMLYGGLYGGSSTAILMRVPGTAVSVIAALDGYEMTKRGRAGAALAITTIASFVAGTIGVVALMLLAPVLSDAALALSEPEFLALGLFALFVLSRLSAEPFTKTMIAAALGLGLATIGVDSISGTARFVFGIPELRQAITITPVAVGLFGVAEVFLLADRRDAIPALPRVRYRDIYPTRTELRRSVPAIARGSVLGFVVGLIPGPSAMMSAYASYGLERRVSKHREEVGHGAIEAVAGPEAANNGATQIGMIPLLLLGIPFTPFMALILGGFTIHGIIPGPLFIDQEPVLFWGIVAGLYAANLLLLLINLPGIPLIINVLRVPRDLLLGGVLVLTMTGTYISRNSMFDVVVLLAMGVLGFWMAKVGLSRAVALLAFVISGFIEQAFVRTFVISRGDAVGYILERPIATTLFLVTAVIVAYPGGKKAVGAVRGRIRAQA
jgi:putative tricarboxylic transport membrane protein